MEEVIKSVYGNKVRVRVCGLCFKDDRLLLVRHAGLGPEGELWAPPGGGIEAGEPAAISLKREFREETGLDVRVADFLFINEYIGQGLHAVELFFSVQQQGGKLIRGTDPEMPGNQQIIKDVRFVTFDEMRIIPVAKKHNIFRKVKEKPDLLNMRGYFKFCQ